MFAIVDDLPHLPIARGAAFARLFVNVAPRAIPPALSAGRPPRLGRGAALALLCIGRPRHLPAAERRARLPLLSASRRGAGRVSWLLRARAAVHCLAAIALGTLAGLA